MEQKLRFELSHLQKHRWDQSQQYYDVDLAYYEKGVALVDSTTYGKIVSHNTITRRIYSGDIPNVSLSTHLKLTLDGYFLKLNINLHGVGKTDLYFKLDQSKVNDSTLEDLFIDIMQIASNYPSLFNFGFTKEI